MAVRDRGVDEDFAGLEEHLQPIRLVLVPEAQVHALEARLESAHRRPHRWRLRGRPLEALRFGVHGLEVGDVAQRRRARPPQPPEVPVLPRRGDHRLD
ncbi:MAG: hypothetical protein AB7N90_02625 [Vicinamibacterales bacterium]